MREHVIGTIGWFSPPQEAGYCIFCGLSKVEIEASDDKACHGGEHSVTNVTVVPTPEGFSAVLRNDWGDDAKP